MKFIILAAVSFLTVQSFAFNIECVSENNLDVSQVGFESLKIESTAKGNWITINGETAKLGDALPIKLNPLLRPTTVAESFTVLHPLRFGSVTFSAGSSLAYFHNKMELQKYRDTVVSLIDFGKRLKVDIDCQYSK